MSTPATGPTAEIFALSEGFILRIGDWTAACTTLDSLSKALKTGLARPTAPPKVTALPTRQETTAALTHQHQQVKSVSTGLPLEGLSNDERAAFYRLCQAWVNGELPDKKSWHFNLQKYCPNLDPHIAELTLAEYTADHRSDDE